MSILSLLLLIADNAIGDVDARHIFSQYTACHEHMMYFTVFVMSVKILSSSSFAVQQLAYTLRVFIYFFFMNSCQSPKFT